VTNPRPVIALVIALAVVAGCERERSGPVGTRGDLVLSVAPLSLAGVGDACFGLEVRNGGGDLVVDRTGLCSSRYGNGAGDIAYVSPCDASPGVAGNVVTVTLEALYATAGDPTSALDAGSYHDPTPVTASFTCVEGADTAVAIDLTIARQANQGFFDVAISFSELFCSAKVDCVDGEGGPLELLHDADGGRDRTVVVGFACTGGAAAGDVLLHADDYVITCGDHTSVVDPTGGPGNLGVDDALLFEAATFRGSEQLPGYVKRYWNVALGIDDDAGPALGSGGNLTGCRLTTTLTASTSQLVAGSTPANSVYPYVEVDVPLSGSGGLSCGRHALDDAGSPGVATRYTGLGGLVFDHFYDGSTAGDHGVVPAPLSLSVGGLTQGPSAVLAPEASFDLEVGVTLGDTPLIPGNTLVTELAFEGAGTGTEVRVELSEATVAGVTSYTPTLSTTALGEGLTPGVYEVAAVTRLEDTATGEVHDVGASNTVRFQVAPAAPAPLSVLSGVTSPLAIEPVEVGGRVYFRGDDGSHGNELMVYDPASGAVGLVDDTLPGATGAVTDIVAFDGTVVYLAHDGAENRWWQYDPAQPSDHWEGDGDPSTGNPRAFTDPSGSYSCAIPGADLAVAADAGGTPVLMLVYDVGSGCEAQQWDGTSALPTRVGAGAGATFPLGLMAAPNGRVYFVGTDASGRGLFEYVPTAPQVTTATRVNDVAYGGSAVRLAYVDGKVYYSGSDTDGTDRELWAYDPVAGTTTQVDDVYLGGGSNPTYLTPMNGVLYYRGTPNGAQAELMRYDPGAPTVHWEDDGDVTTGNPRVVATMGPGGSSLLAPPVVVAGSLYFRGDDGGAAYGRELYRSDGDRIIEIAFDGTPGPADTPSLTGPIALGGAVYLSVDGQLVGHDGARARILDADGGAGHAVGGLVLFRRAGGQVGAWKP